MCALENASVPSSPLGIAGSRELEGAHSLSIQAASYHETGWHPRESERDRAQPREGNQPCGREKEEENRRGRETAREISTLLFKGCTGQATDFLFPPSNFLLCPCTATVAGGIITRSFWGLCVQASFLRVKCKMGGADWGGMIGARIGWI